MNESLCLVCCPKYRKIQEARREAFGEKPIAGLIERGRSSKTRYGTDGSSSCENYATRGQRFGLRFLNGCRGDLFFGVQNGGEWRARDVFSRCPEICPAPKGRVGTRRGSARNWSKYITHGLFGEQCCSLVE